jgi:hypothetical protein
MQRALHDEGQSALDCRHVAGRLGADRQSWVGGDACRAKHPQVRSWCIQLIDHLPDDRALDALVPALDDPVPRVRRNASHALGCVACKPTWDGQLASSAIEKLTDMAAHDTNAKVRQEARRTLACVAND